MASWKHLSWFTLVIVCVRQVSSQAMDTPENSLNFHPDPDVPEDGQCPQEARVCGGCADNSTGLSLLHLPQETPIPVVCDGQGWIVWMRRMDDRHNFPGRGWSDYRNGFGNIPDGSFWLGLENVHRMTVQRLARLRVELYAWDGEMRYADYAFFQIGDETSRYRLVVGGYTGNAGDSLSHHSGQRFTTKDLDNDENSSNCASNYGCPWWHSTCFVSCLNGIYGGPNVSAYRGNIWMGWKGKYYSYKKVEMKLLLQ